MCSIENARWSRFIWRFFIPTEKALQNDRLVSVDKYMVIKDFG